MSKNLNTKIDGSTNSTQTPKGRTKRFLSPSPVYLSSEQLLTKRTKQVTGDQELLELHVELSAESSNMASRLEVSESSHMGIGDIPKVAVMLKDLMFPEIKAIIKEQLRDEIPTLVRDALKEATKSMREDITKLNSQNNALQKENTCLKKSVKDLSEKMTKVELLADSNEQYSRRNSLRTSGIPLDENEMADTKIMERANDIGVLLHECDIDRSQRVGPTKNGQRAIIVKFTSYRARQRLFAVRKYLRKSTKYKHVYINEDITSRRSKLLYNARKLVHEKRLRAAYTSDGKIFIKDNDGKKHLITSQEQLTPFSTVDPQTDLE